MKKRGYRTIKINNPRVNKLTILNKMLKKILKN